MSHGCFIDGDKGHRARISELRQSGDELRRKFLEGIEKAKPQVSLADMAQKVADQPFVFRLERTHEDTPVILENDVSLPLRGVWADAGYHIE